MATDTHDWHHRKPKAQGGRSKHKVFVRRAEHVAWHTLFAGHCTPHDIIHALNTVWGDPDYVFSVRKRRKR